MRSIQVSKLRELIKNNRKPGSGTIVIESDDLHELLKSKNRIDRKVFLTNKTGAKKNPPVFCDLPRNTKKLQELYKEVQSQSENILDKNFDFHHGNDLLQKTVDEFISCLNESSENEIALFHFSDMNALEPAAFLVSYKLITTKVSFPFVVLFDSRQDTSLKSSRAIGKYAEQAIRVVDLCCAVRRWNKVEILLKDLIKLRKDIDDPSITGRIEYRTAFIHANRGFVKKSQVCYLAAIKHFEKADDSVFLLKAVNNLANINVTMQDYPEAITLFRRALGVIYNSMGRAYIKLKSYDEAMDCIKKARIFILRSGFFARSQLIYNYMGVALVGKNKITTAISQYQTGLEISILEGNLNDEGMSHVRLGNAFRLKKKFKKSEEHLLEAHELFS